MNQLKYQRGVTIWSLLVGLVLLGFIVFTALKLFPVYMQDFSVATSVKSLEEDDMTDYRSAGAIRAAVMRRLGINNVDQVELDDISVVRDGAYYQVEVDYEIVIPYIGNLSLLAHFKHNASVAVQQ